MTNKHSCIVGIGETRYSRRGEQAIRGEWALACEAVTRACADAGLSPHELDGLCSFSGDASLPWMMQSALGMRQVRFASMVWGGGGTGACGALAHAVAAIQSGQANYVAVFRSMVQREDQRYGAAGGFAEMPEMGLIAPFGMLSPPLMIAPVAQRYVHDFGLKDGDFAEVALTCRAHAQRNPRAVMYGKPMSRSDYLNSRMIAAPLRLFDCCQENDGACALIVTSADRARDLQRGPVRVLAAAQGGDAGWGSGALGAHNMPSDEYGRGNGKLLANRLFAQAGVTPDDIDAAQIYDHFAPCVFMTLENFGFCAAGEAAGFSANGALRFDGGRLPINTSGGLLSEAYIHGLNLVLEAVRQLRHESSAQVQNAQISLVTAGLMASPSSAAILAR